MQWRFPSTKYIKEDFDKFVPVDFKEKMLARDSSYESEEENPLRKLQEQEAKEFYNMVRSIFNSANINLKNEQLYSPLLEALIKNYSKRLQSRRPNNDYEPESAKETSPAVLPTSSTLKYTPIQTQLLDLASSRSLGDGITNKKRH